MRLSARVDYALTGVVGARCSRCTAYGGAALRSPTTFRTSTLKAFLVSCVVPAYCAASVAQKAATDWQGQPKPSALPM